MRGSGRGGRSGSRFRRRANGRGRGHGSVHELFRGVKAAVPGAAERPSSSVRVAISGRSGSPPTAGDPGTTPGRRPRGWDGSGPGRRGGGPRPARRAGADEGLDEPAVVVFHGRPVRARFRLLDGLHGEIEPARAAVEQRERDTSGLPVAEPPEFLGAADGEARRRWGPTRAGWPACGRGR